MRLYQKDVYCLNVNTRVKSVSGSVITLEDDLFFPEGGGQPCDLGTVAGVKVLDVQEDKKSGEVLIKVADALAFVPGREVFCELDWERRFRHMQMHCGEHIISGAFFRLFGSENRGFHMDEEHITIDLWTEGGRELTAEEIAEAELESNRVIWQDLPVYTEYFDTKEEALRAPLRKAIKADEDISVVYVGNRERPADCCACCGTHPSSAGQVGLIKVIKAEKNKDMTRLFVKAGEPAFRDYVMRHSVLQTLSNTYTTDPEKLPANLAVAEERNFSIRQELAAIKRGLLAQYFEELCSFEYGSGLHVSSYPLLGPDDLQKLALSMEGRFSGVLALVAEKQNTVILTSGGAPQCGQLVRDYAPMYKGKGGGNPKLARAIFTNRDNLDLFLDLLEKHLR